MRIIAQFKSRLLRRLLSLFTREATAKERDTSGWSSSQVTHVPNESPSTTKTDVQATLQPSISHDTHSPEKPEHTPSSAVSQLPTCLTEEAPSRRDAPMCITGVETTSEVEPNVEVDPMPNLTSSHADEDVEPTFCQSKVPVRGERTIVVGVDFGTSTTKVIWQDLSDNHFEIVKWSNDSGPNTYLLPSTVQVSGDRLQFGIEPGMGDGEMLLSSIKLCVLCESNSAICRCGNSSARNGLVTLPRSGATMPASAFACLFLANVFATVETQLRQQFPNDDLLFLWNVGCPMDFLDSGNLRFAWEKMTGIALEISHHVSKDADLGMASFVYQRMQSFRVMPAAERNYFIHPEGLAAVKAFLESPHAETKTYAIIDVGAGTTEVSVFFNGRAMLERGQPFRPSYLADSTNAIGGVRIDRDLAEKWTCTADEARRRKESQPDNVPTVKAMDEICKQYVRTVGKVCQNRLLVSASDKRMDLFVIGGGGRLKQLTAALEDLNLPGGFCRERSQKLRPPRTLRDGQTIGSQYDLLAIACGLASSLDWAYYPPKDMVGLPGPAIKQRPTIDDLYPK